MQRISLARLLTLAAPLLMTGCESSFTSMLWKTDRFHHLREPAPDPAVAVFYAANRKDFLVACDSVREGGERPRRLHYYLGESHERMMNRQKPRLVSGAWAAVRPLRPVPVNGATNVLPAAIYGGRLLIYTDKGEIGPYPLPSYTENSGVPLQVALTPFAVAGDLAFFSLILAAVSGFTYH